MSVLPRARLSLRACLIGPVLALACGPRGLDATTGDVPAETTTTGAPDPTTAAPDPSTTGADDPVSSSVGSPGEDDLGDPDACDAWTQDCPEGQKCMPVSLDDYGPWVTHRCVPLVVDPDGLNQPCTEIGTLYDGLDSCAEGLVCWWIADATLIGSCRGLCTGSPAEPTCADPGATCMSHAQDVMTLCLPTCDALAQDCPSGEICLHNALDGGHTFICAPDASGDEGQAFDSCMYTNECDPGLLCLPPYAAECDMKGNGCCLPLCDLDVQPDLCPGEGQECAPWYPAGDGPPGDEDVGICILP